MMHHCLGFHQDIKGAYHPDMNMLACMVKRRSMSMAAAAPWVHWNAAHCVEARNLPSGLKAVAMVERGGGFRSQ